MNRIITIACMTLLLSSLVGAQTVIENGSEPAEGLIDIHLEEMWRVGGDDDEIFFGTVAGMDVSADGTLYILDGQMSQVQCYAPDGTWIKTMSREGDGPGETRNPGGLFLDQSGVLCLLHGMSGQIVRVNQDNSPAEPYKYSSDATEAGGLVIMIRGSVAGEGLGMAGIRIFFGQPNGSGQDYFLSICDAKGQTQKTILSKTHPINYADFRLDELSMDFPWGRWTVDPDGRFYVAPERNDYSINVYSPDGELERVITREYVSYQRDDELNRIAKLVIEGVGAYHPVPLQGVTIEKTEPDIIGMWFGPDGNLWVQTSRGDREKPEGVYSVYDIFTRDGVFLKQAALHCDVDSSRDGLSLLSDGRIVAITGALDAWLTQQAVERSEEEQDAAAETSLEVVIYRIQ